MHRIYQHFLAVMEVPEAFMDAPVAVIDPPEAVMDPPAILAAPILSPAEALILRIIRDIEASNPPGSIVLNNSRHWYVVTKGEPTIMIGSISMGHLHGNSVRMHFWKEILHPYQTGLTTRNNRVTLPHGHVSLPFGADRLLVRERIDTLSFRLNTAQYNARTADYLGLFQLVLDLHDVDENGLVDFTDMLNVRA
jgi:hypothetical protein